MNSVNRKVEMDISALCKVMTTVESTVQIIGVSI